LLSCSPIFVEIGAEFKRADVAVLGSHTLSIESANTRFQMNWSKTKKTFAIWSSSLLSLDRWRCLRC